MSGWFRKRAADLASSTACVIVVVRRSKQRCRPLGGKGTMKPPEEPRFSIVVPAYNEVAYLGLALQALLQQDFAEPYEIIVVDNDSTDRTGEIAASYGVTVVRETARGVCQARQRGTIEARGEIVVSTDADTVPPRDWLA